MMFAGLTTRRTITVTGPRDADDVWDRYVRPARWPQWSPQIRSVDYPAELLAPDTTGVVHGLGGVRVSFQVTRVQDAGPVRNWAWVASLAGIDLELVHTVEPVAAGTRTTLTVAGFWPVVAGYLPVAWIALQRLVRA